MTDGPATDARAGRWWRRVPRGVLLALAVGFVLRLVWVICMTRQSADSLSDGASYLRMAEDLSRGISPRIGGVTSAFYTPGYPIMLLAAVALRNLTGGAVSLLFAATLMNVALGSFTIVGCAAIARRWIGERAMVPAAWMMALLPGAIYLTSSVALETIVTAVGVAVVWASTVVWDRYPQSVVRAVAVGVLIGYCTMVRANGLIFLLVPVLVRWAVRRGSWRLVARQVALQSAGAALLLVPCAVRNGVQVGVWTPLFTGGASSACMAHRDNGIGVGDESAFATDILTDCYRNSPFDNPALYDDVDSDGHTPYLIELDHPDEAAWYRRTSSGAMSWIATHPVEFASRIPGRVYDVMVRDTEALVSAEDYGRLTIANREVRSVLALVGDLYYWLVLLLVALALCRRDGTRRHTVLLWGVPLVMLVVGWGGVSLQRYHQPMLPFLVVIAAAVLSGSSAPGSTLAGAGSTTDDDTADPPR